jgi:NADH-quinone oxidoreductase subunit E
MNESTSYQLTEEEIDLTRAQEILDEYAETRGPLIPVLQEIQDAYGYVPKPAVALIARRLGVSPHQVFGVITFYAQFHLTPRGKHVLRACCGTACHVRGAKRVTDKIRELLGVLPGETTPDGLFTYEQVACIGACGMAPVMMIDERTFGDLDPDKVTGNIEKYTKKENV